MRLIAIATLVVLIDQWTKHLVSTKMELGQSIALIESFLHFTYVRNPGAAFGMLPYQTALFVVVTLIVAAAILYFYRILEEKHFWLRLGLALMLGGAAGNLIDRISSGYVVDFIDFKIWPPVFNIADSAIVIGVAIFIVSFWREQGLVEERS